MKARARLAAVLCCHAALLIGCGGGASPAGPTPPPAVNYENVAGTWTGSMGGVAQGVTLAGTLTLNIQQSAAALSGGYNINATLTSATQTAPLVGSVTLVGTVASGSNPTVNLTVTSVQCPSLPPELWSGSYGSVTGVLTITGTSRVFTAPACVFVPGLNFPQTILLTR